MNTLIALSALISVAVAIPSLGYSGYDGGYGGYDNGKGSDYSTSYVSKVLTPIIVKKSYDEPIREPEFHRSTKITQYYKKAYVQPVITKTITPVITKSYQISEPQISYGSYGSDSGYGGGYGGHDSNYGSDLKVISYGKGY